MLGGILGDLNQSAIRKHALRCSKEQRNGKFTRVGQDFFDEVEADVEAVVRELRNIRFPVMARALLESEESFVTGVLEAKVSDALNAAIGRLIQNKVLKQPSVGTTLGRTR